MGCIVLLISAGLFCRKQPLPQPYTPSLPPSPSLLPPSCSSSSSLPRVCGCFRAWQEAQIRGLKLNQIFSRYRFLRVPGFPTSSTQLLSIPPLNPSLLLSSLQSQANLCAAHTNSHARMHMGNHKLTQSGGEVQLIQAAVQCFSPLPLPHCLFSLLYFTLCFAVVPHLSLSSSVSHSFSPSRPSFCPPSLSPIWILCHLFQLNPDK